MSKLKAKFDRLLPQKLAEPLGWLGSKLFKLTKYLVLLSLVFVGVIVVLSQVVNRWMSEDQGRQLVCQTLQETLFVKCELDQLTVNLPRRVELLGLRLYLPLNDNEFEKTPTLTVDRAAVRVSLLALATARVRVKQASLDGVTVHAKKTNGVLWTDWLSKKLAEKSALNAEQNLPPKDDEAATSQKPLRQVIRDLLTLAYLPVPVRIEDVGIRRLSLKYDESSQKKGDVPIAVELGPVDFVADVSGWRSKSLVSFLVKGSKEKDFMTVTFNRGQKSLVNQTFSLRSELLVTDLRELTINLLTASLDHDVVIDTKIQLLDDVSGIKIDRISAQVGQIAQFQTGGEISFLDDHFKRHKIQLSQRLTANFSAVSPSLKSLGLETKGTLSQSLDVTGDLDTESLQFLSVQDSNIARDVTIPQVTFESKLRDFGLAFSSPNQFDLAVKDLTHDLSARLSLSPQKSIDLSLKGAVLAKEIQLKQKGRPKISLPLEVTFDSNAKGGFPEGVFKELNIQAAVGLDELLTSSFGLECGLDCQKGKATVATKIGSIEKLFVFVTPLLNAKPDSLPLVSGGHVSVTGDLSFDLPKGPLATISQRFPRGAFLATGDAKVKSLNVTDLKTKSVVSGIGSHVILRAKNKSQTLDAELTLASLSSPHVKDAITNSKFGVQVNVNDLSSVEIKDLYAEIPDLGISSHTAANFGLSADRKPMNLSLSHKTTIKPSELSRRVVKSPDAMTLSGEMVCELKLDSNDFDEFLANGNLRMSQFYAELPDVTQDGAQASSQRPLIKVEALDGEVPFFQVIKLSDFKASAPNLETSKDLETEKKDAKESLTDADERLATQLDTFLEKNKVATSIGENRMKIESYVDVRPTTKKTKSLTARSISFRDLSLREIEVDIDVGQRLFSLNQMIFEFLGGKIRSTMQASFDSKLRQVRLTGQATALDTRKLVESFPKLKDKLPSFSILSSSPFVDGTLRLNYDAVSGDMAGGVEVTRIGKDQLRTMLLYVDPEESNPTIQLMKRALNVGEVRQVSVPIKNGQIGLDLDVRAFATPIPVPKLQRFPLSQLVQNFTKSSKQTSDETIKDGEKGP